MIEQTLSTYCMLGPKDPALNKTKILVCVGLKF